VNLSPITLVCAADDAFTLPLAVTVRSVLDRAAASRPIRLFVMDGGISDRNRDRLMASWRDHRLTIEWRRPPRGLTERFGDDGRIKAASYFRIALPQFLPSDLSRLIYLDSDVLVRKDIGLLWDQWRDGPHCYAVQDSGAPYLDPRAVLANYDRCAPWLAGPAPIPNFRELGLPPDAQYFNSGVLMVDIARWRADDLSRLMLRCLADNRHKVLYHDQYALNVVLCGKWRPLDARWNQMSRVFRFPSWKDSPYDESTLHAVRTDPYIVHFTSVPKPWQPLCRHPYLQEFLECLDRTAWAGTRPRPWEIARNWSIRQWAAVERNGRHACSRIKRFATT
jgi:lipopolysaccharide biosynthesis glycosyltransferase